MYIRIPTFLESLTGMFFQNKCSTIWHFPYKFKRVDKYQLFPVLSLMSAHQLQVDIPFSFVDACVVMNKLIGAFPMVTTTPSAANWCNTHICMTRTHLQPRGAKRQLGYYFSVHAASLCFRNPPNSDMNYKITCVCDHSCVCVYTQRLGTLTARYK